MRVVVVNAGSSSIKYEVFALDDLASLVQGLLERIGTSDARLKHRRVTASGEWDETVESRPVADHREGLELILEVAARLPAAGEAGGEVFGFGHRVVHGGEVFREPVLVDDGVIQRIEGLAPLAPLHNPSNVVAIEVLRSLRPEVPHVAVFDTAFHQTMPPKAFRYAVPRELYLDHGVRRYGFHGTSHRYVAREASRHLGIAESQLNLITLHLGNGASAAALRGGKSVDTSMGLTPLEGLVMGTRCGDLDPALPFHLARTTGMPFEAIEHVLNHESGLQGVCGTNDMREVQRRADDGDAAAALALEMFCYRIKKYVGAYFAALGSLDAIVFTGGIGENSARVRRESCEGLEALGIVLDDRRNREAQSGIAEIQAAGSRVKVLVVPTDEEREIAGQTIDTIRRSRPVRPVRAERPPRAG